MANWINLLDCIYPVGSIYISVSSTSPASIVGGTWSAVTAGATLLAAGTGFASNSYGGNLQIQRNQMPSHRHYIDGRSEPHTAPTGNAYVTLMPSWTTDAIGRIAFASSSSGKYYVMASSDANQINNVSLTATDGDGEDYHPYGLNVYMWKRTA